jgi:antitoxin FitA
MVRQVHHGRNSHLTVRPELVEGLIQRFLNKRDLIMPALTIKNIPDDLYEQLKLKAELHRRSINSEVLVYLEQALRPNKMLPADRLHRIEQLRAAIRPNQITPQDIEEAINIGRS